jgi:hypothetical protein
MCLVYKCQFQHGWNVLWSKTSDLALLECVMVKNVIFSIAGMCLGQKVRFSMAGMCCGQKLQIQHGGRNVSWL